MEQVNKDFDAGFMAGIHTAVMLMSQISTNRTVINQLREEAVDAYRQYEAEINKELITEEVITS